MIKQDLDEELESDEREFKLEIVENLNHELGEEDLRPEVDKSEIQVAAESSTDRPGVDDDDEDADDDFDESCFHCPFCDFMSKSQLEMGEHVIETHERKKTSGRSNQLFTCQVCGRKYQTKSTLEQHFKKDHPGHPRDA